jgi:hypothetical protein
VDGYVYNAAEEPKILMTGKWNESMSYQPCDLEGEPLPGTELKEVSLLLFLAVCTLLTGFMDSLVNFVSSMPLYHSLSVPPWPSVFHIELFEVELI